MAELQLISLTESWKRRAADRRVQRAMEDPKADRRQAERRKEQLPFDGPDRRQRKDRRQYVRRVMTGEVPAPDNERDSSR
jgi:hypothetical protein